MTAPAAAGGQGQGQGQGSEAQTCQNCGRPFTSRPSAPGVCRHCGYQNATGAAAVTSPPAPAAWVKVSIVGQDGTTLFAAPVSQPAQATTISRLVPVDEDPAYLGAVAPLWVKVEEVPAP